MLGEKHAAYFISVSCLPPRCRLCYVRVRVYLCVNFTHGRSCSKYFSRISNFLFHSWRWGGGHLQTVELLFG